eukprot:m.56429 g.56429  ORF g.56429 m.56429 type:complete len:359 (+) comp12613_c0_seq1:587-1663(+)
MALVASSAVRDSLPAPVCVQPASAEARTSPTGPVTPDTPAAPSPSAPTATGFSSRTRLREAGTEAANTSTNSGSTTSLGSRHSRHFHHQAHDADHLSPRTQRKHHVVALSPSFMRRNVLRVPKSEKVTTSRPRSSSLHDPTSVAKADSAHRRRRNPHASPGLATGGISWSPALERVKVFDKQDAVWHCSSQGHFRRVARSGDGRHAMVPQWCFRAPRVEFDDSCLRGRREATGEALANGVCVERVTCCSPVVMVFVRVANLCFDKQVFVRITWDSWRTHHDMPAAFLRSVPTPGHHGRPDQATSTDRFFVRLTVPFDVRHDQNVEFAVCYKALDCDFWDNNKEQNFRLQVRPGHVDKR